MFAGHRGNIGIYCGNQFVLIDADGDEGVANLANLGPLPRTLTAISGSGSGRHLLYRLAPGQNPQDITDRSSKVANKIDIKIRGQFVVAPSVHVSGQQYQWVDFIEPELLPDWLYQRLRKKAPTPRPRLAVIPGDADTYRRVRSYIAKMPHAVSGSGGHGATFAVAQKIVNNGLTSTEEWALIVEYNRRCEPPWSDAELEHKLKSARDQGQHTGLPARADVPPPPPPPADPVDPVDPADDWRSLLIVENTKRGVRLKRTEENLVLILRFDERWRGRVRFDSFRQKITIDSPPWKPHQSASRASATWTDTDVQRLKGWSLREYDLDLGTNAVIDAVRTAAEGDAYHSAADWMATLTWDGTPRLAHWLTLYLGADDTEYVSAVGRWWLLSAVARAFQPGCKADHVLILEGPQGTGKSSALRALVGSEWFADTPIDIGSKDAYLAMAGRIVVELGELDSLRRADAERAKAFFTSAIDHYRPPYGRETVAIPRSCVFAGTVNHAEYLKDETGNRRYWPIACMAIDLYGLARDRNQIWAEAVAAYQAGQVWYPVTVAEHALCEAQQDARRTRDAWEAVIGEWVTANLIRETTVADILERALQLPKGQWGRADQMRVAAILRDLGFKLGIRRVSGRVTRVYTRLSQHEL